MGYYYMALYCVSCSTVSYSSHFSQAGPTHVFHPSWWIQAPISRTGNERLNVKVLYFPVILFLIHIRTCSYKRVLFSSSHNQIIFVLQSGFQPFLSTHGAPSSPRHAYLRDPSPCHCLTRRKAGAVLWTPQSQSPPPVSPSSLNPFH